LSGVPAVQLPDWQVFVPLHTVPSESHDVPFATGTFWQPSTASHESAVHGLPSLQLSPLETHVPAWQVSVPLHARPSSQLVPLATATCWQPSTASHESAVHGLPSSQLSAVPAAQLPDWHSSAPLQTFPSPQLIPLGTGVLWQPSTASHESAVQTLPSSQLSAVPAVQEPPWHVSAPLHTVASAQLVPFVTGGFWHPSTASHESAVQTLPSSQASGVPGVHAPAWQVSAPLHTVPSAQLVPFATAALWHPSTGSQLSAVHGLPSSQASGVPAVQLPDWQLFVPLHTVPSTSHDVPFATGVLRQPSTASHESAVHTLPSSQLIVVPTHTPLAQLSAAVQTVPSVHALPFGRAVFTQPVDGLQLSFVQPLASSQSVVVPPAHTPA
jgi:hypothetical protein